MALTKRLILLSFTILNYLTPLKSQLALTGKYSQDCTIPIDDPPPNGCSIVGQDLTDNGLGKIECSQNFDCCLCGQIICGDSGTPCDSFSCNGDSGCFGVQDIKIYGSPSSGAVISCNGDESCNGTKITGENIAEVACTGDGACARTTFDFSCVESEPCAISCVGDDSCAGTPYDDDGLTTDWQIKYTAGIECSSGACKYGKFELKDNSGGGAIMCTGEDACLQSQVTINNIEMVSCGGMRSCMNASFLIIDPMQDFSIECSATDSCVGLQLEIIINNDIDFFKGITCAGSGCIDAEIAIYNQGSKYITVENLECLAPHSCEDSSFDFDGGTSGIGFENCKCGEGWTHACDGITGIDSCLYGLEKLECSGEDSCHGLQQFIANVANDFEVICSDARSCREFWLMIVLDNNARDGISFLKGYKCDSDEACMDGIIQVKNEQRNVFVEIDTIECNGDQSCENTRFIIEGNVAINEIKCSDNACRNCVVENANDNSVILCNVYSNQ